MRGRGARARCAGALEDRSASVGLGEPEPVDGRRLPHHVGRWKWPDLRHKV